MLPYGYTVTRDGRVEDPSGHPLFVYRNNGYAWVKITHGGVTRRHTLRNLVCTAFHGPPPTPEHVAVNIDGDPFNNHADNLKWGTRHELRVARGTEQRPDIRGEGHALHVLTAEQVRGIRQEYSVQDRALRPSQRALARKYGVSLRLIYNILHNKAWHDPEYVPVL